MIGGLWLQHANQAPEKLVGLADDLANAPAGRPGVVLAPVNSRAMLQKLYKRARPQGDVIVDPLGFLVDRKPTERTKRHFPWLHPGTTRSSAAAWSSWMERSIEYQVSDDLRGGEAQPSALITPCPQLVAASGPTLLARVIEASERVRGAVGADCWISINVDRDYLRQVQHLTNLVNRILASDPPGVLFRCFQNDVAPVSDRFIVEGFREVVEGLSEAGIEVILPNSGWLGWMSMAWGALAFSGGLAKGSWYDRMPAPMNTPPRYETIFEAQLLRHVRWPQHQQLAAVSTYQPCWCASCQAMGGVFDADEAKVHQIRLAHEEGASLRALDLNSRVQVVTDRLDEATDFRDSLRDQLRSRVGAGFLDTWRASLN